MELQLIHYFNNSGTPNPISSNTDPIIFNKPEEKKDSLKMDIKTQPGEVNIKDISLYIPFFKTSSLEALIKLLLLLKKIIKSQNLTTIPQIYAMPNNILTV